MRHSIHSSSWSTTSLGGTADTSPMELDVLGQHLLTCRGEYGHWLTLQCAAERLHAYIAARLVTSLVVAVTLLAGVGWLLLRSGPV